MKGFDFECKADIAAHVAEYQHALSKSGVKLVVFCHVSNLAVANHFLTGAVDV